ncbi:hypothetical protein V7069_12475 [Bacillus safensis]|uniref:hypothetical protein n=1 Tax=Bacillus safensis TaxID=561879 RepID=UPI002FFDD845
MKKELRSYLSLVVASVILISLVSPVVAQAQTLDRSKGAVTLTESEKNSISDLEKSGVDTKLVTKLLEVSNHIHFKKDQKTLSVDLSDDVLMKEYDFTKTQLKDFKAILDGTYNYSASKESILKSNQVAKTSSYRAGYLSNTALKSGTFAVLTVAAQSGPAALMAAWTAVSSALAGPLGTVAGISTAVLGGAFFADLALKITGAMTQGKGVAFYLDWGIPPVKTVIE